MDSIEKRLDRIRTRFSDEGFLTNKGLSNEVGLYIFSYSPNDEMAVRAFITSLKNEVNAPASTRRILHYDLYDVLLDILRSRRLLDRIPQKEAQIGQQALLGHIQKIAGPEAYVERLRYDDHRKGDIVLISGIGKVYPYMRSHNILNNIQHVFSDVPVVMFYPGEYNGQSLRLFERFSDDNYYRAFNLM